MTRSRIAVALLATCGALALPAFAAAEEWKPATLPGLAGKSFLLSVSCPSRSLCVTSGTDNMIATSTNPTGGPGTWDPVFVGEGSWPNANTWPNLEISGLQIEGISCPSTRMCVGVMNKGLIYSTTNPTGPASAWKSIEIDKPGDRNTHLAAISCPTTTLCVAVSEQRIGGSDQGDIEANLGKVLVSTDPTGGADSWSKFELDQPFDFTGVSCPRADLCIAVGADGQVAVATEPRTAAGWRVLGPPNGPRKLGGVACVSTALCLSGNSGGELLTTTSPTGGLGGWKAVGGGGSVQVTGVACPSVSECIAVDDNGSAITSTDPTGGSSAWNYLNVVPYVPPQNGSFLEGNGLFGVSCPSRVLCVTTGARGQIFTNTDPFAPPPPPVKKRKPKHGMKRPKAHIATVKVPFPNSVFEKKGKVHIRFFARGRIKGFVCKFGAGKYRKCHSPIGYKVNWGHYVFKVRAVGTTGFRGPVAKAVIRIKRPCSFSALSGPAARPKGCGSTADY